MFTKFDRIDLCKSCKHALSLKKGSSDKAIIGHPVKNVFRRLIVFFKLQIQVASLISGMIAVPKH